MRKCCICTLQKQISKNVCNIKITATAFEPLISNIFNLISCFLWLRSARLTIQLVELIAMCR